MWRSNGKDFAIAAIGLPKDAWAGNRQFNDNIPPERPRHRQVTLPGICAFASEQSVAAGDALCFQVSSSIPYQLQIIRLGSSIDDDSKDAVIHRFETSLAKVQAIAPGSCIYFERGLTTDDVR
jgi:hypothetical protein